MPDRFGRLGLGRSDSAVADEPRSFPWKLAAVAVGVAIIAAVVGRTYLPGRTAVTGEPGAPVESPAAANPAAPAVEDDSPIPAGRGRLVVVTQPPGIKVLLDRKPVGETPLRLDVTPGRRMLTFLTNGGEVIRSVRVPAGRTESVDIPVFSGWVAVFAPIVLSVAADGKNIGTTEDSRLMLPPGKHQLTLSNRELGYTSTQEVEIEPGEVKAVNVDPRGTVNLNAVPWAEVWLDGQKLGDTPLAETPVPLGTREFVFKNPQFGERKVSATIKGSANAPVAVDFTK
jgi:PEGA domain